ncbi:NAD-binding of NADP-dependent 3-hydroxyisobutyrate dehydrogenase family protein [Anoxybacillus sp. B7M1]|jgi:3-hydroxyisobutyrate dehydrogenase|uniref:NAD(P)-dependent oxidoreductase n=1 Tax=unclassified Anoxybacillus TaxID=2639704 RepID=UPI0005CD8ED2|nr:MULTISPECIES: NAD(P)-dependent oxidoreductase [unclassified Anoxybacillus]ANB58522.1 NAD-binding of NADP-dependent 3-hydroxyisobutyrate dehydrogenase family protein [Anoxybacillus sp. B2M1]ANB63212.1 NAD-binding of NADP-dependent 3-hydroxyisobutyrate dehydrogenase family protein [Anoxybacillus sp. B7M1]
MKTIGFIGLGVMGQSMARNLLQAGYDLLVHTRTKEKAEELLRAGAVWKETVRELAREADVVITMVGYPQDVEAVYFGENGLIENVKENTYLIDMTTSPPSLAEKIYDEAKKRKVFALDAPVSGGDVGAREGRLAIMVGGDEAAFHECKPIFEVLGTNIVFQGKAGAGQHAKMCNQIAIATNMIGVCEALIYAKRSGLDPYKVLESISQGAAGSWSLSQLAPRMLAGDFAPGFYVKHFIKDMKIALEEAEKMNLQLPGLSLAKKMYEELAASGEENSGTHALYKHYDHS